MTRTQMLQQNQHFNHDVPIEILVPKKPAPKQKPQDPTILKKKNKPEKKLKELLDSPFVNQFQNNQQLLEQSQTSESPQ